jgi:hypothetical protein
MVSSYSLAKANPLLIKMAKAEFNQSLNYQLNRLVSQ